MVWAALWCFLSAVLEEGRRGKRAHRTQERRFWAIPRKALPRGTGMSHLPHECVWNDVGGIPERAIVRVKTSWVFFLLFKSGLCHTIVTVTVPFVLWSKSIDLLLGQDKGLDSPENKLLVFPLLFKLPLSWKLLAVEDDFFFMSLSSGCVGVSIWNR